MGILTIAILTGIFFFFRNRRVRYRSTIQYDTSLPQPSHYLLFAFYITAVAVASSFFPLRYRDKSQALINDYARPHDTRPALELIRGHEEKHAWQVSVAGGAIYVPENTSDFISNILFAMPVAYLWMGVFLVDSDRRLGKVATIVVGVLAFTAVRILIEWGQQWVDWRVVARWDVIAQSIGIGLGSLGWLVAGQRFTDWIRSKTIDLKPMGLITWALTFYLLGFLVYTIWPLEITLRGADLARKFRDGLLFFIPFSEPEWQPKLLLAVVTYVPVGMLLASGFLNQRDRLRSLGACLVIGALIVIPMETLQMFVVHRMSVVSDFFSGLLGIGVGWSIMYIFLGSTRRSRYPDETQPFMARIGPYLIASGVYATFLYIFSCAPFRPITDETLITARYQAFYQLVIDSGRFATEFEAVLHIVRKALMFAPLGALLAMTAVGPTIPTPIRAILLSMAVVFSVGVAFTIEMLQVYLPPHVSDIMDVLWCAIGSVAGVSITAYLAIFKGRRERMEQDSSFA
ncbi:MAG: VanZ family protein [Planctomycetales bacterium]|nr:VanZ family protein [Planctomycetales bacterium]